MPTPSFSEKLPQSSIDDRITKLLNIGYTPSESGVMYFIPNTNNKISLQQVSYASRLWFKEFLKVSSSINKQVPISEKGLRYNTNKPKWSLVDFKSLEPMVRVMEYGAAKYAPHNWKKGMSHTEISECLMRHLVAYLSGEDTDPESGESHVAHIQCNAMFLQYNIKNHPDLDDRFKPAV